MHKIIFTDINGREVQVSMSAGGDYRIYYDKEVTSPCLLLNKNQANILINALKDLMGDE